MSELRTSSLISDIKSKSDLFDLLQKTLQTSFPVAIWRLPQSQRIHALIDITSQESIRTKELENVHQGFLLNGYDQNHPIDPLLLQGDVIITFDGEETGLTTSPSLSASQLEVFLQSINENQTLERRKGSEVTKHPDFIQMVNQAIDQIKEGQLHKVVLSRFMDVPLDAGFDALKIFEALTERYDNAFCYLTQTRTFGTWMGATPEKLLSLDDNRYFSTDALAGTQLLQDGQKLSEIAWTQKEIEEQAMVSRYIIDCFKQIRLREFDEIGPRTTKAGDLAHLKTEFKVDMEATNSPMLGSTMLELLHPTSAVCGSPLHLANEFIKSHEDYSRALYAGFLGPTGFNGTTRLFVNLRCMQLFQDKARLYAGAGITEDSVPEKELAETDNKMQTLLKVLRP